MRKQEAENFDHFVTDYRNTHTKNIGSISGEDSFYFSELKIKELLKYEKDSNLKVLDFGCGDGVSEIFFQKYFPGFRITGIDVSNESIKRAQEKQLVNSVFENYDGQQLPYENLSYDIVFVACVFHHIVKEKQPMLMNEIQRVLKNKGRLYFFEHNPINPFTRYVVKTCQFDKGVKLIFPNSARKLLKQKGFSENMIRYIIFFPRYRIFIPFLFLEKYLTKFPFGGQYYLRAVK
jgi:ubiquinone/menaquinone biosynthesis C-methylase UbiE